MSNQDERHLRSRRVALVLAAVLLGCDSPPQASGDEVYTLEGVEFRVETVARNLEVPWDLAWLPDGRIIVTQRQGKLTLVDPQTGQKVLLAELEFVEAIGEGGLMGIALSPQFEQDRRIYLGFTTSRQGRRINRISSFRLPQIPPTDQLPEGTIQLADEEILVDDLPASSIHDGLGLAFGPDGKLYASTGDAGQPRLAQQPDSLAGKFLRLNPDGTIPDDNPIQGSPVWTLGHRNSQGFDWQPGTTRLYATEHGPTGGDELNLIIKGENYGWPIYHHDRNAPPYIAPLRTWTPAIAPAGATFYISDRIPPWQGGFFFASLRGQGLWYARFNRDDPRRIDRLERLLHEQYGRLRQVAQGPDGLLYLSTSNRDGRGTPAPSDDRILRLVPIPQPQAAPTQR